jgi:hypothetical protein
MFGFNNFGDIIQFSSGCDMTFSETATVQAEKWTIYMIHSNRHPLLNPQIYG